MEDSTHLIDGRAIAAKLNLDTAQRIKALSFTPLLCDIVAGDDAASLSYMKIKAKKASECGMNFRAVHLPGTVSTEAVIEAIAEAQLIPELCGLLVQLPLPLGVDKQVVLSSINPAVDVDLINPQAMQQFYSDTTLQPDTSQGTALVPPTAGAIMTILNETVSEAELKTLQFVVAGQGELVGKPVTHLLKRSTYQVQVITSETQNSNDIMRSADVIISGMGQPGLITSDIIKEGVIIIDAGTSESEGAIKGDVDLDSVLPKARLVTPTPGGVGPVTVAKLLQNVLIVAEHKQ